MSIAFVMHPDFLKHAGIKECPADNRPLHFGIPIHYDRSLIEWEPPTDPFIEYEPKDYGWLRKLGYGRMVPKCYQINTALLIPQLF